MNIRFPQTIPFPTFLLLCKADESSGLSRQQQIEKFIEEAEEAGELQNLDEASLKQSLINLEKKINKNQILRMKFSSEPEKFMDSELDLNSEINDLFALAASPELYKVLVDAGSVDSVLGMVAHENTDISLSAIGLLQELTEPDSFVQCPDAICLVDGFLASQGLELIVQNLTRLDEKNEEDATGVYNTISIIENLVAVKPTTANMLCTKTHFLTFLLERLAWKVFDSNKLFCSEILCVLLQADMTNTALLSDKRSLQGEMDGVDALLQILFQYRKKEDLLSDEEECIHNLFHALCVALRLPATQGRFHDLQGMELMVKCLKEMKYAAMCAIRAVNYSLTENKRNAMKFLLIGGLKYIFPMLLGKGLPKPHIKGKKKALSFEQKQEMEEDVISIICQMSLLLYNTTEQDCCTRLLGKFIENDYEKIEHCAELFVKYSKQLEATDYQLESVQIAALRAQMEEIGKVDEEDEEDKEEADIYRHARRLEGGLQSLQQLSIIILFAGVYGGQEIFERVNNKLKLDGYSLHNVLLILRETAARLTTPDDTIVSSGFDRHRNLIVEWCATLAGIEKKL